jgi:hypothetical protein
VHHGNVTLTAADQTVALAIITGVQDIQCPRRNVPDFGMVFLMLKYTDIIQNTYIQS